MFKYALCDFETIKKKNINLEQYLKLLLNYDTTYLQYRDTIGSTEDQIKNLKYLKNNCNLPILINNSLELLEFCDGIHLEKEGLSNIKENILGIKDNKLFFKFFKKKYQKKIIGLSTNSELEILEANSFELDYITFNLNDNNSKQSNNDFLDNKLSYFKKISKHKVGTMDRIILTQNNIGNK